MNIYELIFLKLGGSLITDKNRPLTPRIEIIQQIAIEISEAIKENPNLKLLLGHGSGSFGHATASAYQTQKGGKGKAYWLGYADVWQAARQLNQLVVEICHEEGLPVISFPPSAGAIARNETFQSWDIQPIKLALSNNLIPLVQGDVVFDTEIGGTIFSTEKSFQYLSERLFPKRILLAGIDQGVYRNANAQGDIFTRITPETFDRIFSSLSGSETTDVTGGMLAKVELMIETVKSQPTLEVQIFSGTEPGNIKKVMSGEILGTLISV